jgi:hypothetical protein
MHVFFWLFLLLLCYLDLIPGGCSLTAWLVKPGPSAAFTEKCTTDNKFHLAEAKGSLCSFLLTQNRNH